MSGTSLWRQNYVTPRARWNTGSNPDLEVSEPPEPFSHGGVPQGMSGNSLWRQNYVTPRDRWNTGSNPVWRSMNPPNLFPTGGFPKEFPGIPYDVRITSHHVIVGIPEVTPTWRSVNPPNLFPTGGSPRNSLWRQNYVTPRDRWNTGSNPVWRSMNPPNLFPTVDSPRNFPLRNEIPPKWRKRWNVDTEVQQTVECKECWHWSTANGGM